MNEIFNHTAIQETKTYIASLKKAVENMKFPPNPLVEETNKAIGQLSADLQSRIASLETSLKETGDRNSSDIKSRVANICETYFSDLKIHVNDVSENLSKKIFWFIAAPFILVSLELAWIIARH